MSSSNSNSTNTIKQFLPGNILGKFEIIKRVDKSGQAHVYIARVANHSTTPLDEILQHINTNSASDAYIQQERLCVLKIAAKSKWSDSIEDEHDYLADKNVQHPRIIKLFFDPSRNTSTSQHKERKEPKGLWLTDFETTDGKTERLPYIAIEYMPGGTLKHVLDRHGRRPLPPTSTVQIALQVAEALQHLHTNANLIHHDISPDNITFRHPFNPHAAETPDCVLIDLAVADRPDKPSRRKVYGKKIYLPPERLQNEKGSHGPLVDVYGLGVVIYECLVGQLPSTGTDAIKNIPYPLPPIREHVPNISTHLATLVDVAVHPDPTQRPNLQQLVDALRSTTEARIPTPTLPAPTQSQRSMLKPMLAVIGGLLVLAVLIGGIMNSPSVQVGEKPNTPTPTLPIITPTPFPTPTPTQNPTSTPTS